MYGYSYDFIARIVLSCLITRSFHARDLIAHDFLCRFHDEEYSFPLFGCVEAQEMYPPRCLSEDLYT